MTDLAPLHQPIETALRPPKRVLEALARLGVKRVMDLLNHFPRAYNAVVPIGRLKQGMTAVIFGDVAQVQTKSTKRKRMKITEAVIRDDTGAITAVFFNQPWLSNQLKPGRKVRLTGPVEYAYHQWTMRPTNVEWNPESRVPGSGSTAETQEAGHGTKDTRHGTQFEPEYPLSEGLYGADVCSLVARVLPLAEAVPDPLPDELVGRLRLMPIPQAYRQAHAPDNERSLAAAGLALKYREFFLMQAAMKLRRQVEKGDAALSIAVDDDLRARARRYFPFALTAAQERCCREIEADLTSPGRMHRLLQGDVGSGKTAVALYAALLMLGNGYQSAFMAPTEVLARQHHASLTAYLRDTKVRIGLLLGGMKTAARDALCADVAAGRVHILIGTHALLEDYLRFSKLGLCVIDEQHKFGVRQRAALRAKGNRPHVLAMSATPIPRTLSMTLYGAMDVSIIDELPPGRTPVKTTWVPRGAEAGAYERIRRELREGGRAYFVFPLVSDSEAVDLKSALTQADELKRLHFADFRVGVVHGRMKSEEKDAAVEAFRRGELDLLAATVVVEVGVDVPEANIMVIENAERFGLSQLHQLRGRVGRGRRQSYLYLMGDPRTEEARQRIEIICRTHDGFEIAEQDLKLRGFGDFAGTRQSGLPKLHIGDLDKDLEVLERARRDAARWGEKLDPRQVRACLELHYGKRHRLLDV
jgi:ATP-dependent DNA helicase RecG